MTRRRCANDAPRMRGCRSRNEDGRLRDKRDDTLVRTIEKQYGVDLDVRSDMTLGVYQEKTGARSLHDIVHKARRN